MNEGKEYFWLCQRAMSAHKWLTATEAEEVLAESVFLCFSLPYELSYALAMWAVKYAIRKHCIYHPRFVPVSIHRLPPKSYHVFQPELKESNIVDLGKYRKAKNDSHFSGFARQ